MEQDKIKGIDEVTLIAGYINATGKTLFWKYVYEEDAEEYEAGDYAIVENMNGHDLIKIVGVVKTKECFVKKLSHTAYKDMKKVKGTINKNYIEK